MKLVHALLLLFFGALMIGFGACGVFGVLGGLMNLQAGAGALALYVLPGVLGLAIAWVCWKVVAHSARGLAGTEPAPEPPQTLPTDTPHQP